MFVMQGRIKNIGKRAGSACSIESSKGFRNGLLLFFIAEGNSAGEA